MSQLVVNLHAVVRTFRTGLRELTHVLRALAVSEGAFLTPSVARRYDTLTLPATFSAHHLLQGSLREGGARPMAQALQHPVHCQNHGAYRGAYSRFTIPEEAERWKRRRRCFDTLN